MRRAVERCGECAPGRQCPNHLACATHRDAALAAEIGVGWALFVRHQVDVRKPWPPFSGRAAAIAKRLVGCLAGTDHRHDELARIAHWRAGLKWESLELPRIRDRPYEAPDGEGTIYQLPGPGALCVHFRTRRATGSPYERRSSADTPWPAARGRRGH